MQPLVEIWNTAMATSFKDPVQLATDMMEATEKIIKEIRSRDKQEIAYLKATKGIITEINRTLTQQLVDAGETISALSRALIEARKSKKVVEDPDE